MKPEFLSPVLASVLTAGFMLAGWQLLQPKKIEDVAAEARAATVIVNTGKQLPTGQVPFIGSGIGSGWFIDDRGDILTAWHVADATQSKIFVTSIDGKKYKAKVVYENKDKDITILHIDGANGHKFLTWGDSDKVKAGDTVIEAGNPYNYGIAATRGIVSIPVHRNEGDSVPSIQYDAATNPGNSGGPIVNKEGEAIGMADAIYAPYGQSAGLAFALPAKEILQALPPQFKSDPAELSVSPLIIG